MKKLLFLSFVLISTNICSWAQIELPSRLSDRPELIIKHTGYTVSYNIAHGTPNWVAWMLTKSHAYGKVPRSNQFLSDPLVPLKYRVTTSDYQGSGFDRGHMAPAADMAYSPQYMHDSFYMTNMCPQVPALNRVSWKQLETACRKWVLTEDTLYVVAGPVYTSSHSKKIGRSHIIDVPDGYFKVILSIRRNHPKAIGFYYLNNSKKQTLYETASTVDYIEHLTGIDFFYQLEDNIEEQLESRFNLQDWH